MRYLFGAACCGLGVRRCSLQVSERLQSCGRFEESERLVVGGTALAC